MEFKSLMHVSFFVEDMDKTIDFYCNKLGLKIKMLVRNKTYINSEKLLLKKAAMENPEGIFLVYFEIAPGQFIEAFSKLDGMTTHDEFNLNVDDQKQVGYTHFAVLVEDIYKTHEEFIAAGIELDAGISIGSSYTYKMWAHDPDGNKFEIMQYTDKSFQVVGNFIS